MSLELLLTQISNVTRKYEEIYKFSGEKFNIFNLLNLSGDELSHSRIIATLLNPKGMHEKENKFMELFLKCIEIDSFSLDNVIIETEKFIGYISDDHNSGGRIDITVTNSKKEQILIENKIYANDQWNQLLRYNEYNPKAHLIYLTLFGDEPSEVSIGKDKNIDFIKISYKEHILKWLELCKLESIDSPLLRETLTQYIVLIKQLTGQARSKKMQKEYLDIILKDVDNVSASFIISQSFNDIKLQIIKEKFVPVMTNLGKNLEFDVDISLANCFAPYWGFSFFTPKWKYFKINFEFESGNMQNLIYGFCGTNISQKLDKYLRSLNYKSSKAWPLYQYMDNFRYWNRDFFLELYTNEYNIINVFENKIKEISLIVKDKGYEL